MAILIEKELGRTDVVNGYAELVGPFYHLYKVDGNGEKTFIETVTGNIEDAARKAERIIDVDVLMVAYKENPNSFKSVIYQDEI